MQTQYFNRKGPYKSGFSRGEVLASKTKILLNECDLVNVCKLIAERDNWRETADRFREAIDADEALCRTGQEI